MSRDKNHSVILADPTSWIPEGFSLVMGPENNRYVVPDFFVPALQVSLNGQMKKDNLNIENADGSVSNIFLFVFFFVTYKHIIRTLNLIVLHFVRSSEKVML
jgi:hypothetical protein